MTSLEQFGITPEAQFNLDLERAALFAAFAGDGSIIPRLLPEDFHDTQHRKFFEAFHEDFRVNASCDLLRVDHSLRGQKWYDGAGGLTLLMQVTKAAWTGTPDEQIVDMLRELLIRRTAAKFRVEIGSARETIETFAREAEEMRSLLPRSTKKASDVLEKLLTDPAVSVPFGFPCLDEIVQMTPGQLIVIGARPGVGKTAMLCNVACHHARQGKEVLYCTIEMTHEEVQPRFISILAGRPFLGLGRKAEEYLKILDQIAVDDRIEYIGDVEAAVAQSSAELCIVDYIQLLSVRGKKGDNRVQELEEITRRLKRLAQRTGKILLCACQLKRDLDGGLRKPVLSDLKGSGSFEQDANTVIMMHNPFLQESDDDEKSPASVARDLTGEREMTEFLVRKNRSGRMGRCKLKWIPEITTFRDTSGKAPTPTYP